MTGRQITAVYILLMCSASFFIFVPLKYREWGLIIAVVFLGPLLLGYFHKPFSLAVLINSIYLPAGIYLPRLLEDRIAKKVDTLDHLLIVIYLSCTGFIIGAIMLYTGKLMRHIVNAIIAWRK